MAVVVMLASTKIFQENSQQSDMNLRSGHVVPNSSPKLNLKMDFDNPGLVTRMLLKMDMGIFYLLMRALHFIIICIDVFLELICGFTIQYGSKQECNKSLVYDHSAQVVILMGRGAYSIGTPHQLHNFLWRHEKYVHPRYVLEHDNITLMGVTPSHAFFCVSDPDVDVYNMKVH